MSEITAKARGIEVDMGSGETLDDLKKEAHRKLDAFVDVFFDTPQHRKLMMSLSVCPESE